MKKFMVWGIALALVISMGIVGFIWFTNNGAAEENRVELATMIEWELERHDDYDYEVEIDFVKYLSGRTRVNYWASIDDGFPCYGSMDVTYLENQYNRYH